MNDHIFDKDINGDKSDEFLFLCATITQLESLQTIYGELLSEKIGEIVELACPEIFGSNL